MRIRTYDHFGDFAEDWAGLSENYTRLIWQLLARLDDDEILLKLPEWLAEEKVGWVDGGTPTEFVGRIDTETEKAIRVVDSTAARPLAKLAHRMVHLEEGLQDIESTDHERRDLLSNRLQSVTSEFESREDIPSLREEWLPKSQIIRTARRN